MENQSQDTIPLKPLVKASFCLGLETYVVNGAVEGSLSEQLVSMKEGSMAILKEYITKHNAPTDVPDDLVEESSDEEEEEIREKCPVMAKKTKYQSRGIDLKENVSCSRHVELAGQSEAAENVGSSKIV